MHDRHESKHFRKHTLRWFTKRHARPHTDAEKDAALRWFMVTQMGALICRCDCYWRESTLDDEAQQLGVTIVRRGETQLDVCPRCALYAKLLGVLESRVQGVQLSLF